MKDYGEKLREFTNDAPAKKAQNKARESVFAITINSNKDLDEMTLQEKNRFKGLISYLFNEDAIYMFIHEKPGNPPLEENLVSQDNGYNWEIGEKVHRIHVHGIAHIAHKTFIGMDFKALRKFINDYMGYSLHVDIQARGNNSAINWQEYMTKGEIDI